MRRVIRWLLSTVAVGLVVAVLYGMVGEFFIEWARKRGWYDRPSQRVDAAMNALTPLVTQTWFVAVTALFVGLAVGGWIDTLLRRREAGATPSPREPAVPAETAPASPRRRPIVVTGKVFMNERVVLDGYEYIRCTFINCTLSYDSKEDAIIKEPTIKGTLALTSNNPVVDNTVTLLYELGVLRIGIADRERGQYLPPKPKFIGKPHDPEQGPI